MRRGLVGAAPRSSVVAALLIAIGGAGAGCGDSSGSSDAKERAEYREANESPKAFVTRMAKLLETSTTLKDCAQIMSINTRSELQFRCPAEKKLRKSMARFKVNRFEDYGPGAVVDYKSGTVKDNAAIVLFVAGDRNWGIGRFGLFTEPSVGTSDEPNRTGYARVVEQYVAAIRERDCDALAATAFDAVDNDRKAVCDRTFSTTKAFTKRLNANPAARARYRGGNGRYGFFTLETAKPRPQNWTISVMRMPAKSKAPYLVLDVASSPTAAVQSKFRRQIEKKQQQQSTPQDMEPSSKPSDSPET
jgi:hypothetical protein